MIVFASPASAANTGGAISPGPVGPAGDATIAKDGSAVPPADAPPEVVAAITAANEIEDMPYEYGGGHAKWNDDGYDCSSAVSYALHAADMLDSPLDSSGLMKWGERGRGDWITVYSNPGHAYAVIAGLRWDTSMTDGDGPGWSDEMRPAKGFKKRSWDGL